MVLSMTKALLWYTPLNVLKMAGQALGFLLAIAIFLMVGIPESE